MESRVYTLDDIKQHINTTEQTGHELRYES